MARRKLDTCIYSVQANLYPVTLLVADDVDVLRAVVLERYPGNTLEALPDNNVDGACWSFPGESGLVVAIFIDTNELQPHSRKHGVVAGLSSLSSMISHECVHALQYVMSYLAQPARELDEMEAYVLGWLVRETTQWILKREMKRGFLKGVK